MQAGADLYASDYGTLKVVPNRFMRDRTALVFDPEYAAIAYLRPAVGSGVVPEAIVPEPAFEIFRFDTAVAGGRLVQVMPRAEKFLTK